MVLVLIDVYIELEEIFPKEFLDHLIFVTIVKLRPL